MCRAEVNIKSPQRVYSSLLAVLITLLLLTGCKSSEKLIKSSLPKEETRISHNISLLNREMAGVSRVVHYDLYNGDIPESFDGTRIAFITDLHYPSYFKSKHLDSLVKSLDSLSCDILCLGGDFHEDESLIAELFEKLGSINYPLGAYGVLGNNDYERGYDKVVVEMLKNNINCLEHQVDTIWKDKEFILMAGVRDPFNLEKNGVSPTLALSEDDFVILITHTPDYAEDVPITNSDIVLAGHTHGGQVSLFGFAPVVPSKYDQRFLRGLVYNSKGIPMIVSNGIGTSTYDIRVGAPSEIVVVTLHSLRVAK